MKILITAGSTQAPIDKVRCVSNIFKGKTGHSVANHLADAGHEITLLTSNSKDLSLFSEISVKPYNTYNDLYTLMGNEVLNGGYDAIIHSSAVSDYEVEGVYRIQEIEDYDMGGNFYTDTTIDKIDSSTKVSSDNNEIYLKLVKTKKIIKKIKCEWGFKGKLIGFKLLVGVSDAELVKASNDSILNNNADAIIANCLEWSRERAIVVTKGNTKDIRRNVLNHEIEALL